jgi:hypothetical protein
MVLFDVHGDTPHWDLTDALREGLGLPRLSTGTVHQPVVTANEKAGSIETFLDGLLGLNDEEECSTP